MNQLELERPVKAVGEIVGKLKSKHYSQLLWTEWRGRRDSNPRPLP